MEGRVKVLVGQVEKQAVGSGIISRRGCGGSREWQNCEEP